MKSREFTILAVFLIMVLVGPSKASADWLRRFDGAEGRDDSAQAIALDSPGNIYVTGESDAGATYCVTIKYAPNGKRQWVQRQAGTACVLAVDQEGNVFVAGTSPPRASTLSDFLLVKYSTEGTRLWMKRYDGPAHGIDEPRAIAVDRKGNVFLTGASIGLSGRADYATVKYDGSGVRKWVKRYDAAGQRDDPRAMAVDGAGNVYVTGFSQNGWFDYATIKYSNEGTRLWVRRFSDPSGFDDYANAIRVDGAGNVYVTGTSQALGTGYDFATLKYDTNGKLLWKRRHAGVGEGRATALALDPSGNLYVTGFTTQSTGDSSYLLIKYGPGGAVKWRARYNGPGKDDDIPCCVETDSDGNVFVTGGSIGAQSGADYATIKYAPDGTRLWVRRYNGPGNSSDEASAMAINGSGNAYVTGKSMGPSGWYDFATIEYSQ